MILVREFVIKKGVKQQTTFMYVHKKLKSLQKSLNRTPIQIYNSCVEQSPFAFHHHHHHRYIEPQFIIHPNIKSERIIFLPSCHRLFHPSFGFHSDSP